MMTAFCHRLYINIVPVFVSILFSSCISSHFSEITAEKFVSREGISVHRDNHLRLRIGKHRDDWYLLGNRVRYNTNNISYVTSRATYDVIHENTPETFGFKMDKDTVDILRKNNFNKLTPIEQGALLTPVSKESSQPEKWVYLNSVDNVQEIQTPFRWRVVNTKITGQYRFPAKIAEVAVFVAADIPATIAVNLALPVVTLIGFVTGAGW